VARIGLTGLAGSGKVTARLPDGLAIAITAATPIRVADAVRTGWRCRHHPTPHRTPSPAPCPGLPPRFPEQTAGELRLRRPHPAGFAVLPLNLDDVLADASTTISTAAATPDWAQHEVTADVPGDCRIVMFGIFLAGSGPIELPEPELARGT
jgi:hypothetical protein